MGEKAAGKAVGERVREGRRGSKRSIRVGKSREGQKGQVGSKGSLRTLIDLNRLSFNWLGEP